MLLTIYIAVVLAAVYGLWLLVRERLNEVDERVRKLDFNLIFKFADIERDIRELGQQVEALAIIRQIDIQHLDAFEESLIRLEAAVTVEKATLEAAIRAAEPELERKSAGRLRLRHRINSRKPAGSDAGAEHKTSQETSCQNLIGNIVPRISTTR